MGWIPRLVRLPDVDGRPVVRLGHRLADDYLEFLAARTVSHSVDTTVTEVRASTIPMNGHEMSDTGPRRKQDCESRLEWQSATSPAAWKCSPLNGYPVHRFTPTLPRQIARHDSCSECEALIEAWEGPQTARTYDFTTREIAQALVRVAGGASYRSTAALIRRSANRRRPPGPQRLPSQHPNKHGQVVASWVDVFAPIIWNAYAPSSWPTRWCSTQRTSRPAGCFRTEPVLSGPIRRSL